jgi:Protein of unknown function (DUF3175)
LSEKPDTLDRKLAIRRTKSKKATPAKRWSQKVTRTSNALDLEPGVFTWRDPRRIVASLRRSALSSSRRKSAPFRSAMSMLSFYINRAGRGLPENQKRVLLRAKAELRKIFEKENP